MSNLNLEVPKVKHPNHHPKKSPWAFVFAVLVLGFCFLSPWFYLFNKDSSRSTKIISLKATSNSVIESTFSEALFLKLKKAEAYSEAAEYLNQAIKREGLSSTRKAKLLKQQGDMWKQGDEYGKAVYAYYIAEELNQDEDKALSLLERMQQLGWVQGLAEEKEVPKVDIEVFLPVQLKKLSQAGRALLADESGFLIAQTGFSDKTAAKLSALSADVFSMYERHEATLRETLSINKSAWAVVDAVGNSDIGFWPMWVGDQRFILVVKGVPLFNQDVLLDLIWALYVRYGN